MIQSNSQPILNTAQKNEFSKQMVNSLFLNKSKFENDIRKQTLLQNTIRKNKLEFRSFSQNDSLDYKSNNDNLLDTKTKDKLRQN